jgi:tripartite-type tricarboxylate transporter receptor subunit TctC
MFVISRRLMLICLIALGASHALAQSYPNKPVRIVVSAPAGGAMDTATRMVSARLQEALGQPVVIENKSGANGVIGADFVAKSPPDGYTLLMVDLGAFTTGPAVSPKLPFDPDTDFAPITMVIVSPYGVTVNPSVPVNSVKELIDYAKANPGKLNYATLGIGSASHLVGIDFGMRAGVSWSYIPYKGGAQALPDVASGHAQMLAIAMLSTYPFVKSGKLRLLAVMSHQRLSFVPEVPTMIELGYPDLVGGSWQALYAPKGTPREIVMKLHAETLRVVNTPDMKKRFADQGAEVMTTSPEELGRLVTNERAKWTRIVRENNIKVE